MNLFNIIILIFLLGAFAIGVSITDLDKEVLDHALNNASLVLGNITLDTSTNNTSSTMGGFFKVLEQYVQFIGTFAIEIFRVGIHFGQDNPGYFEPTLILGVMKLIVWLVIISLLIKPVSYLVVFIILGMITLNETMKKRKAQRESKSKYNRRLKNGN